MLTTVLSNSLVVQTPSEKSGDDTGLENIFILSPRAPPLHMAARRKTGDPWQRAIAGCISSLVQCSTSINILLALHHNRWKWTFAWTNTQVKRGLGEPVRQRTYSPCAWIWLHHRLHHSKKCGGQRLVRILGFTVGESKSMTNAGKMERFGEDSMVPEILW